MYPTTNDLKPGQSRSPEPCGRQADSGVSRREFLKTEVATGIQASTVPAWAAETQNGLPYRRLGRTGEKVSVVGLGGYHIGIPKDEQEAIRLVRTAIDRGINFMDNRNGFTAFQARLRRV